MIGKMIGTLICAIVIFVMATTVSAQPQTLKVNIPFDFILGGVELGAGQYMVDLHDSGVLQLMNAEGHILFSMSQAASRPTSQTESALLFNRYGDAYFLSQVFWEGGQARVLPKSGREIELAKKYPVVIPIKTAAK